MRQFSRVFTRVVRRRTAYKRLGLLRNKVKAHLDVERQAIDRLMRSEIIQLFKLSDDLLNRFSIAYFGNGTYFNLIEDQAKYDTQSLLAFINGDDEREFLELIS